MSSMPLTRKDTEQMKADVEMAFDHIRKASHLLEPWLPVLSAEDRENIPRARKTLFEALPQLFKAVESDPQLAELAHFDPEAVAEDRANVELVSPLLVPTRELAQRINDAVLAWTGEVVVQTTTVYRVAQALQKRNPALRTLVDVLKPVFALGRRKK